MKIEQYRTFNNLALTTALLCLLLCACSKNTDIYTPGNGNTASLNFYGVSQTFPFYEKVNNAYGGAAIFMDTVPYAGAYINTVLNPGLPYFSFDGSSVSSSYPYLYTDKSAVLYLDYYAGRHDAIFSYMVAPGANKPVDTPITQLSAGSFTLEAGSRNILYFTDADAAEGALATYQTVCVPEPEMEATTDGSHQKVSVRIVHLSADAGNAGVSLLTGSGVASGEGLPQSLAFGDYSDYVQIDTTGNTRYGQLELHIHTNGTNAADIVAGIPAKPGHRYHLLITGVAAIHSRRLVSGADANGNLQYKDIALPVSLGTIVRQIN